MKKFFGIVFLGCITFFANAQVNHNTRLWEITHPNNEETSYVIGTVHSGYEGLFEVNDSIYWALDQSKLVAFELDNDDMSMASTTSMMSSSRDLGYLMLECVLELLPKYKNVPMDTLVSRYSAGIKGFYETDEYTEKTKNSRSMVFDDFLTAYARYKGKKVDGIETMDDQINALFSFTKAQLSDAIKNFFDNKERFSTSMMSDSIVFFAAKNQSQEICEAVDEYTADPLWGSYYRGILDDRNVKMVDYVVKKSKKSSMTCAVGLGHMCGQMGILSLLKKKGFSVRPINISSQYSSNQKIDWKPYSNKNFSTQVPGGVDTIINNPRFGGISLFGNYGKRQKNVLILPEGAVYFEYANTEAYDEDKKKNSSGSEYYSANKEDKTLEESLEEYIYGDGKAAKSPPKKESDFDPIKFIEKFKLDKADDKEEVEAAAEAVEAAMDDDEEDTDEKEKKYATRFVEFWSKVNDGETQGNVGSIWNAKEEEDETKIDTLSLGVGLGNYTITYGDDVVMEYKLPHSEGIKLRLRGDEKVMKRKDLLDYFRKAAVKKED